MYRTTIPIHEIIVKDRQRQDLGDINSLSNSLRIYGLIQPIVINQEKRLVAGGRRLAAASQLGWSHIDVVFRETLTADELHELELEENVRRKDLTWQERCINIASIHALKRRRSALEGAKWGQRETAEVLGLDSHCSVGYALTIARELQGSNDSPLWKCDSMMDAWRLVMRRDEEAALAELVKIRKEGINDLTHSEDLVELKEWSALSEEEARQTYLSNPHNDPNEFESYYIEKRARMKEREETIYLSGILKLGDSIAFMHSNTIKFDHIVTDIPYGIDMENLSDFVDIDTVEKEHDIESNKALIHNFFPAAFACTKDHAFVVTWCDQMFWQFMYDCAINAGFRVQRWPITWSKTHACQNQSAGFNFTKTTEIAIVCRKPGATLMTPATRCDFSAGTDSLCDQINHPFAKPYECWRFVVDKISFEGQTILDPFMGRGSGIISMLRMNRKVVGVELNEAHHNAAFENVRRYFLSLNPNFKFK